MTMTKEHAGWIREHEGRDVVLVSSRYGAATYRVVPVVRLTATQIVTEHTRYNAKTGRSVGGDAMSDYLIQATDANLARVMGGLSIARLEDYAYRLSRAAKKLTVEDAEALDAYLRDAPVELPR